MALKNFNLNTEKNIIFDYKALAFGLYTKSYIRHSLDNKRLNVIDSGLLPTNSVSILSSTVGFSFLPAKTLLSHKFNKNLKLESFFLFSFSENNLVSKLLKDLKFISGSNNSLRTFLFLNPVKGGFKVYSFGAVGFMPKSHSLAFLKRFYTRYVLIPNIKKRKKSFFSNKSIDLLYNFNIYFKYFFFRIPYSIVSSRIGSFTKKRNFSNMKSVYYNKKNSLNFVFLSKKQNLTSQKKNEKSSKKNIKKFNSQK